MKLLLELLNVKANLLVQLALASQASGHLMLHGHLLLQLLLQLS